MADAAANPTPVKTSKAPLIIGLLLALVGAGGGFFAVYSGMILGGESAAPEAAEPAVEAASGVPQVAVPGDISFVPVDPMTISLGPGSSARHLIFRAELEVATAHETSVRKVMPRIVDVLNSYLRAVEPGDLADPSALVRLRGQMLRRVQIVTGPGAVRDLLVMEFVLN